MTAEERENVRNNIRKLTNGTLLQATLKYINAAIRRPLEGDDLEIKLILTEEAVSRGLMR